MTQSSDPVSRRDFIRRTAHAAGATAGLTAVLSRSAYSGQAAVATGLTGGVLGANDKIRVALIGSGGRGQGLLDTFLHRSDIDCPVVCDVDDSHVDQAVKVCEKHERKKPDTTKDFRSIIDRKDVDAVIIGSPDHWHPIQMIHACAAGKDVYTEKPCGVYVKEGRAMVEAARKYDRVVQVGTQWASSPHFRAAIDYVHSGKLGPIRQVRAWTYLAWVHSVGKHENAPVPPGVDYDMWLGPAPQRPFNPARFHFSWRWFWDYAGGLMTDWGVHLLNIALMGLQKEAPKRVTSYGGKYIFDDMADTPDTQSALYDFGDCTLIFEQQVEGGHGAFGREHGIAFWGTEGTLIVERNGWEVKPGWQKDLKGETHGEQGDGGYQHVANFVECMRTRKRPTEDIAIGHRASKVAQLGNISLRIGRSIEWDDTKEEVVGDAEANQYLMRPYREPWSLEV